MSECLRLALAVEGPTDRIALEAILDAVLPNREFQIQTLQPEGSVAFESATTPKTGMGWGGVYRWCRQSASEGGGSVSDSTVLDHHDLLIVHIDADVAGKTYASSNRDDAPCDDLPSSTGSARPTVLRTSFCVRRPRKPTRGCWRPCGPTIRSCLVETGSVVPTRRDSFRPCPRTRGCRRIQKATSVTRTRYGGSGRTSAPSSPKPPGSRRTSKRRSLPQPDLARFLDQRRTP